MSYIPENQCQQNKRSPPSSSRALSDMLETRKSIQHRLNNIYYSHHPVYKDTMNVAALTQQHMDRASQVHTNNTANAPMDHHKNTLISMMSKARQVKLKYSIYDCSSYSGSYHPQNIIVNQPTQQASRWSSGLNDHEQFITIKFDKPVIARSVMFGKFHKGHVCNLKEFKVYGGVDPKDDMIELLHHGLRNDTEPETFSLKYQYKNLILPIKYIKIVPLSAFGANFNYSIWYLEVRGINEPAVIQRYKETETVRLCLKYFRQRNMMDTFYFIKDKTGVELEHPLLSQLHQYLVVETDFEAAERVLQLAHHECEIYRTYSDNATYKPIWRQLKPQEKQAPVPMPRGGHQMCIDVDHQMIYILGGWDGKEDLSDFWSYDIQQNQWKLLSEDTQIQGGPGPRSCHKSIFVLGRYVESSQATNAAESLCSDFYRITNHTACEGGPELIFDHQMCVDPSGETLYVFGGRTVNGDTTVQNYSGLYAYHIKSNQWKLVRNDDTKPTSNSPSTSPHCPQNAPLKSRVGHSMLFDQTNRSLYVFAGQRGKDYLSDLYRYDVDQDMVTEIAQDYTKDAGPDAGFNQRATIDAALEELYVLSGYKRNTNSDVVKNALGFSIKQNEWHKIYQNENKKTSLLEPCPRYAHQMVYDAVHRVQYIFGGNPGDNSNPSKRLNDFWELRLVKPDPSSILRRCFYMIRMQKLKELCNQIACMQKTQEANVNLETLSVLKYLRNQVAPVVDYENEKESKEFHQMCANLCLLETMMDEDEEKDVFASNIVETEDILFSERTRLFEKLLEYIPQEMKEPLGKLTNAVKLI
ncbi:Muskelin N-terminus-domain-containing protein [Gilbertella persicaria]|uniref:Muskelin N-terminus-domain-containing protein n=1 Tax=Gilbertella persicaria TaxID=101096 RepID=UPI00222014E0|nr:Muskelin N-terminus-domain-containing protein [Gilbertella persicaria]XP_051429469.1 Muskelin N-terminus-domain-containing protein [Gilbertella persicaria]XP_051430341.1 Muskelin N-terminus-domain-containing protein [Gilbertella persicaria]KAI8047413.1 Muskelin N-terminus-domain-containing protein [Gilbertella persicaria]KAI8048067.1 Muskelin N-terminus-domain-containing protein [Gilbertella persicaria]KAI8054919.1 Muskelin N-terminus-domain-containing protein [Gilbertella persicaria]